MSSSGPAARAAVSSLGRDAVRHHRARDRDAEGRAADRARAAAGLQRRDLATAHARPWRTEMGPAAQSPVLESDPAARPRTDARHARAPGDDPAHNRHHQAGRGPAAGGHQEGLQPWAPSAAEDALRVPPLDRHREKHRLQVQRDGGLECDHGPGRSRALRPLRRRHLRRPDARSGRVGPGHGHAPSHHCRLVQGRYEARCASASSSLG